ncbi:MULTISPECIES: hydroxyethylthiazole kinase [Archaeoglobus]|jgi:hydroxyethylthiazole kinase|uniref:Hydroxyethylthiazole kinase n=3 Tax=Archaeoglobus fulgidus TaxID=2234 RepID=THIM_ARCFU|nr:MULTISPECIES: hydroxyethylthiazole kinase [Archaeoglobus]O28204.1 RecName: Full=Hydroxyethylthiazole kinase; AltName: Full=4-methyl-5-beta-hydroxyethylthiazole kinase; Short=TH kinase; Short=Thz kinase [Archaeoglobus fulgidus DSM 4304]AAB89174.1 hydroxyethylthiazole kinase (thiM) [Archaeoglobus fulgidus DSM 4304]AIG99064.1 hydroxyethylthiazole kinase [Archaeoglobus fulgidus DSM 8774]KUJ93367.1 MAG: Hydroxyethylthiazole kinase [Archaeoglobus fulgidus]KUK06686.1 MAG: Hydroxyethylthiazole kina
MHLQRLKEELERDIARIAEFKPVVHHITNYVAMNDSANITIAIGASPIMSFAHGEIDELVSIASSLLINIGTLDEYIIQAVMLAVKSAKSKGVPVLLDPVGSGATKLRTSTALSVAEEGVDVIKGNQGEILSLLRKEGVVRGVDSKVTAEAADVKEVARKFGLVVVATGKEDLISDGRSVYVMRNGTEMLGRITASGCMLGSVIASFMAVQKDFLLASLEGLACYNVAGELAAEKSSGTASFRSNLIDEISKITAEKVIERLNLERVV